MPPLCWLQGGSVLLPRLVLQCRATELSIAALDCWQALDRLSSVSYSAALALLADPSNRNAPCPPTHLPCCPPSTHLPHPAALHGLVNTIDHHGGSSLKLFVLLLGHTTALYGALAVLYTRLALPASGAVLGVMLLTSLLNGERMCRRVLESPGVEAPLADLHSLLGLAQ